MKLRIRPRKGRCAAHATREPFIDFSVAQRQVKGEDVMFVVEDLNGTYHFRPGLGKWSLFCICDGHGGTRAAKFVRSHLGSTLTDVLPLGDPPPFNRPEGAQFAEAVRRSLVVAFKRLNEAFAMDGGRGSGTTVSVGLICGWMLTMANVGDSEVFLNTHGMVVEMTCCHKVSDNMTEQNRLKAAGLVINRLCKSRCGPPKCGEEGVGPLRVWPGGIAMSRSLGDENCGPHILPVPHVRQIIIPATGGRMILASDGLWDHVSGERACREIRNIRIAKAAEALMQCALASSKDGQLSDDTSVLVLDILRPDQPEFLSSVNRKFLHNRVMLSLLGYVHKGICYDSANRQSASNRYLYADIDGMIEYPELDDSHVLARPDSSSTKNDPQISYSQSRGSQTVSESDGWDLCTASWQCTLDAGHVWEYDERDILDSAQSYSTSRTTRTSGATPQVSMMLSREMRKNTHRKRV